MSDLIQITTQRARYEENTQKLIDIIDSIKTTSNIMSVCAVLIGFIISCLVLIIKDDDVIPYGYFPYGMCTGIVLVNVSAIQSKIINQKNIIERIKNDIATGGATGEVTNV